MEKRYRALRIIGSFYKIVGAIVLVLTILGALGACGMSILGGSAMTDYSNQFGDMGGMGLLGGVVGGVILGLTVLISGGVGGLTMYAVGEGIYLLIDIEENTRAARVQA